MALTKLVNGQRITMDSAEETATQNDWTAGALADWRSRRRQEFKSEALVRIAAQVPAWDSFARIEFLLSISNLLDLVAMTSAQTLAKDTLLYARDTAIPRLVGLSLIELQAIDPAAADPFGDGTLWPT